MVDPINYSGLLTQVNLAPLQQGLAQRRQNQILEDQMQERQQVRQLAQAKFDYDKQKDADYLTAVETYKQNPTPAALRDLAIRFPEQSAALMKAGESYSGAQKQDLLGAGFGALGALSAGKNDLAVKTLEDRVTALKGSGIDTSHTQAAIDMIKSGDTKGAQAYLSYAMSGLVGADHAAGILDSLGVGAKAEDRRADNERQAAQQAETARHNRVTEGQGAARVDLSRQAGARAAAKANGTTAKGTRKLPTGFVLD